MMQTLPMITQAMQEDAVKVLKTLASFHRQGDPVSLKGLYVFNGPLLSRLAMDSPARINDAVELLEKCRFVEVARYLGSEPFRFQSVQLTARGRLAAMDIERHVSLDAKEPGLLQASNLPMGYPSGLAQGDWERIASRRMDQGLFSVVFMRPVRSDDFDACVLESNLKRIFKDALASESANHEVSLDFMSLSDEYGLPIFSETACSILSSDIAVFEISNLDPDVMMTLGMALTWGTRVLPIARAGSARPLLDIPVQTWAEYRGDGTEWTNKDFQNIVCSIVRLALMKKGVPVPMRQAPQLPRTFPPQKGTFCGLIRLDT